MGAMRVGIRRFLAVMLLALVAGCSAQYRNHGYAPRDDQLAQIAVGKDTRDSVTEKIGTPGTAGLISDDVWYYVESRFKQMAFLAPREINREVVAISFSRNGRVSNIERFGMENGRIITLSRRVTKTTADKVPFLRRVFGSLISGTFN